MTDTQQLLARLAQLDCAAICDADKTIRVMDYGIRPISKRPKMVGIAHTVRCRDDFLSVIKGLEESVPGEVLVVDAGGSPTAVVGELFATEARRRGLAGIVVDGACRDTRTLQAMLDFSVYAKRLRALGLLRFPHIGWHPCKKKEALGHLQPMSQARAFSLESEFGCHGSVKGI